MNLTFLSLTEIEMMLKSLCVYSYIDKHKYDPKREPHILEFFLSGTSWSPPITLGLFFSAWPSQHLIFVHFPFQKL